MKGESEAVIEGGYVGGRAPGIDISILLPTRRRPDGLRRAVNSVLTRATHKDRLDIIFCTDHDDRAVMNDWVGCGANVREFRGERRGYARLFEHYNEMALAAWGRVVLLWNDDTEMLTDEWDRLLIAGADSEPKRPLVQFLRRDIYGQADTTLPFIDKRIVDALGGISRHMYTDTWIGEVAASAGVLAWRNDVAYAHHWPQQDATMREGVEAIRQSGQHERFKAMSAEKAGDVAKIHRLLAELGA